MSGPDEPEASGTDAPDSIDWPLTREALHELVWKEPATRLAVRLGVSSSYLARVCTLLDVPRPARGYWAKLAVGKAPARRPLPPAEPGQPRQWTRGDELLEPARPTPRASIRPRRPVRTVPPRRAGLYPLVRNAKPLVEAGRLSRDAGYLKPAKRLSVDLAVTRTGLDRALSFANELFVSLKARGHRVVIAPRSERLCREEIDVHEAPGRYEKTTHTDLWHPW